MSNGYQELHFGAAVYTLVHRERIADRHKAEQCSCRFHERMPGTMARFHRMQRLVGRRHSSTESMRTLRIR
jgi:hypothetical protein